MKTGLGIGVALIAALIAIGIKVSAAPRAALVEKDVDDDKGKSAGALSKTESDAAQKARKPTASPLTIGTLYGFAVPLYAPRFYAVDGRRVVQRRASDGYDYAQPGVFVLPSIAVYSSIVRTRRWFYDAAGKEVDVTEKDDAWTVSVILPAGLTVKPDGRAVAVGIGAALGRTVGDAEVGLALAVIWSQVEYLSGDQKASFQKGTDLVTNASAELDTRLMPSLTLGLYLSPTF